LKFDSAALKTIGVCKIRKRTGILVDSGFVTVRKNLKVFVTLISRGKKTNDASVFIGANASNLD
jgi:hypothetical protein